MCGVLAPALLTLLVASGALASSHNLRLGTGRGNAQGLTSESTQLVVACNGFPDADRPAMVGVRPKQEWAPIKKRAKLSALALRPDVARQQEAAREGAAGRDATPSQTHIIRFDRSSQTERSKTPTIPARSLHASAQDRNAIHRRKRRAVEHTADQDIAEAERLADDLSVHYSKSDLTRDIREEHAGFAAYGSEADPSDALAATADTDKQVKNHDDVIIDGVEDRHGFGTKTPLARNAKHVDADALWTRPVIYGTCEEISVDMTNLELFFIEPRGHISCALATPVSHTAPVAAVLTQPDVDSNHCIVQGVTLQPRERFLRAGAAEIWTLDAFARQRGEDGHYIGATAVADGEADAGSELPPLESVVLRVEDVIDKEVITSEVVGTRSLILGETIALEPRSFHIILEEPGGSSIIDNQEVTLKAGRSYLVLRIGRSRDPALKQKLLVHLVDSGKPVVSDRREA